MREPCIVLVLRDIRARLTSTAEADSEAVAESEAYSHFLVSSPWRSIPQAHDDARFLIMSALAVGLGVGLGVGVLIFAVVTAVAVMICRRRARSARARAVHMRTLSSFPPVAHTGAPARAAQPAPGEPVAALNPLNLCE